MWTLLELIVDFFAAPRQTIAVLVICGGAVTVFLWTVAYGYTVAVVSTALYVVAVGGFIEYRWRVFRLALLGVDE